MKKLSPIRIAIIVALVAALGALYAFHAGVRFNAAPAPERLYRTPPKDSLKVLFIGNSHTFGHDVPGMLQRLGEADNNPIWVEAQTIGGATLNDHLKSAATADSVREGDWDFVILQEQSTLPALNPGFYQQSLSSFAAPIARAGVSPVIYATWARNADNKYFQRQNRFATPRQLQSALDRAFAAGARQTGALVAPVGTAWHHYLGQNPGKRLHAPDGNHANHAGAYLAACVFYRVLTDKPSAGNPYHPDRISPQTAAKLQRVADRSPEQWQLQWGVNSNQKLQKAQKPATPAPTRPPAAAKKPNRHQTQP